MSFLRHVPGPPLDHFVEYFYCPIGPMPYACEDVMPAPVFDLKINFGDPFLAYGSQGVQTITVPAEGWCMGVWDACHAVRWPNRGDYIGVSFRAGGAAALFDMDAAAFRNGLVPLDAIFGPAGREMRERLQESAGPHARFGQLERMLRARLRRVDEVSHVQQLVQAVERDADIVPMGELTTRFGISQKHLITLFNRVVGVPPKKLARLRRLQRLLRRIERDEDDLVWTRLAHDHLYCDQAHFNRDFKRLTGSTPACYLARRQAVRAAEPSHARHLRLLQRG